MRAQAIALAIGLFIGAACTGLAQRATTDKPSYIEVYSDTYHRNTCYYIGANAISCLRD